MTRTEPVRLMVAGLFQGVVDGHRLLSEALARLAARWFAGCRLEEKQWNHAGIALGWGPERVLADLSLEHRCMCGSGRSRRCSWLPGIRRMLDGG